MATEDKRETTGQQDLQDLETTRRRYVMLRLKIAFSKMSVMTQKVTFILKFRVDVNLKYHTFPKSRIQISVLQYIMKLRLACGVL